MGYYIVITSSDMWFGGKWMQLEDVMLNEVNQTQKIQKPHVFPHIWKIDPNDKPIHKNKHDHIQTQLLNMFVCNSGTTSCNLGKEGKKRE
jgi:hypothetical protein